MTTLGGTTVVIAGIAPNGVPIPVKVDADGNFNISVSASVAFVDGQGDSILDDATNSMRVNVVAGGAGGGAVTVADGDDVTQGALADAIVAAGAAGSLSAKLRRATQGLEDLKTLIVLAAGNNNIGDVDIASLPNEGQQTMANSISVAIASDQSVVGIGGNVAHSAADSGNPIKVGYKAIAHGTNPTAVDAAERTDAYANRAGIPFSIGGHPNIVTLEAAYTAAQTDTAIITVGAGVKIVVTAIEVTLDEATTVGVGYRIGFGTANTPTTTGVVSSHPGLVAGSGVVKGSGAGIIGIGADGEDLRITSEVPTTGSLRVVVTYYTIES